MIKFKIILVAPLMVLLLAVAGGTRADSAMEGPVDFSLEKLGGGTVSVSDYRGQWLVVNYWATWCAPCIKEMPELSALHTGRDDLVVLGLAYEEVDDATLLAFLDEVDVDFPILKVDVYNPPQPFGTPMVLPTTYVVDPDGMTVKTFRGPVTREDIESVIDE